MVLKKNRLLIFVSIGIIIILGCLIVKYYNSSPNNNIVEKLTNSESIDEVSNNIVLNGNFNNKENISSFVGSSGTNDIIQKQNPGESQYVLRQTKSTTKTYYQFNLPCISKQVYVLKTYVNFDTLYSRPDLDNLVKIVIPNNNGVNKIPYTTNKIIKKITLDNNTNWYEIQYIFISPSNSSTTMNIYLNYSINLQANKIYFTDVSCYRVLINAIGFTEINDLISMLYGKHYIDTMNSNTWKDITNNGKSFNFNSTPLIDNITNGINIYDNKITGPSSLNLLNSNNDSTNTSLNEFSISMIIQCNSSYTSEESNTSPIQEEFSEEKAETLINVLNIPGNNGPGIQLYLPLCEGRIKIVFDGSTEFYSQRSLVFYVKSVLTIVYSNSMINVFQDGVNVLSASIGMYYPNNDNVVVNPNFNWNATIFGLLVYNKKLSSTNMKNIYSHFIQENCDSSFIDSEDLNILASSEVYESESTFTDDIDNSSTLATQSNIYNQNPTNISSEENSFLNSYNSNISTASESNGDCSVVYNTVSETSLPCRQDCMNMCSSFLGQNVLGTNLTDYQNCISSCKNTLPSCKNYCCSNDDSDLCGSSSSESESNSNSCPIVYKKNGNYTVYVDSSSPYATSLGRSGEINYGSDRESAAYIYQKNFPNCSLPAILTPSEGNNYKESCPFKITDNNPCYSDYCENIDWSKDPNTFVDSMNKQCKHIVSNYCEINNKYDDSCLCWSEEYRNKPECRKFRRKFQDPNDYQCNVNDFEINEHSDFKKYIQKDKIPCWGCDIK